MKVGLVPLLYKEYNYGGVLQFYALQKVIRSNNIDTEILVFENDDKAFETSKNKSLSIFACMRNVISYIKGKNIQEKLDRNLSIRKTKIDEFRNRYYSTYVYDKNINYTQYNAVICGSDQVWNPRWARKRCFLEFVPDNVPKIIYGASLGCTSIPENMKIQFKEKINRLQYVSVREISAKELLDSFINSPPIKCVVDPTLLVKTDEWHKMIIKPAINNYILTYFLGEYNDKIGPIKGFAKAHNLRIINIPFASTECIDNNSFGDIEIIDADPREFLGLLYNACFIFTDSFHACVFSIHFKKDFFVFRRNNSNFMLDRIKNLLENFNMEDRLVMDASSIVSTIHNRNIDVDFIMKRLRADSTQFLLESINGQKNK